MVVSSGVGSGPCMLGSPAGCFGRAEEGWRRLKKAEEALTGIWWVNRSMLELGTWNLELGPASLPFPSLSQTGLVYNMRPCMRRYTRHFNVVAPCLLSCCHAVMLSASVSLSGGVVDGSGRVLQLPTTFTVLLRCCAFLRGWMGDLAVGT